MLPTVWVGDDPVEYLQSYGLAGFEVDGHPNQREVVVFGNSALQRSAWCRLAQPCLTP
jgi:hypothetical protein